MVKLCLAHIYLSIVIIFIVRHLHLFCDNVTDTDVCVCVLVLQIEIFYFLNVCLRFIFNYKWVKADIVVDDCLKKLFPSFRRFILFLYLLYLIKVIKLMLFEHCHFLSLVWQFFARVKQLRLIYVKIGVISLICHKRSSRTKYN